MSDNLRDRIAAVVEQHHTAEDYDCKWPLQCECDAKWRSPSEWGLHVADAVIRELGLRRVSSLDGRYITADQPSYCIRCGYPHTTPCLRTQGT